MRPRQGAARLGSALSALTIVVLAVVAPLPAAASPASIRSREWWIGALGLEINNKPAGGAWQFTRGARVTVAVLDQGVDATVPDLSGALVTGFATGGGDPDAVHDSEGHGTQMATFIAGRGRSPGVLGVAPESKVMPVFLTHNDQQDTTAALDRLAAMATPPQIVSMSYGNPEACPSDLQDAVARAVARGMILVASSGNSGDQANQMQSPADCKGVVVVGAFDEEGRPWTSTQRQPYVAIGGPGVDMVTFNKQRTVGTADGTSNAAAVVSGELVLLRAHWPTMPSRQLLAKLFGAVSPVYSGPGYGSPQGVLGYGVGVVNRALRQSVPASAPNAVYDDLDRITRAGPTASPSTPTSGTATVTFPGSSGSPGPGTVTEGFPGASSGGSDSGSDTGVILGVVGGVVVLIAIVVVIAVGRRRQGQRGGPTGY